MGCDVVPGNVYAFSGCHCGPYSSSINNRSSIGMIGCLVLCLVWVDGGRWSQDFSQEMHRTLLNYLVLVSKLMGILS